MKYYLQNAYDDAIYAQADDIKTALQVFAEECEGKRYADLVVRVWIEKQDGNYLFFKQFTPEEFFQVNPDTFEKPKKARPSKDSVKFAEMAKNFTPEEQYTVLQYVPTGFIIGELSRRLEAYSTGIKEAKNILNNLPIYHND